MGRQVADITTPEQKRQRAAAYLQSNGELRQALGIGDDAILEPQFLGAGEHNENYWFADKETGTKYVLRINVVPQPFHKCQVAYEHEALKTLVSCGRTPLPLYMDTSRSLIEKDALVISFCTGDELNFDALRPHDLTCAVQLMADIHAVPVPDACKLYRPADPLRDLFDECMQRFELYRTSGFEDARITKWAELFIKAAQAQLDGPAAKDCNHIINTETLASHFLIPADANRTNPGFFVDWERPLIGEVAQDVAFFTAPTTTCWDSEYLMPVEKMEELIEVYWDAVDKRFDRADFDARFKAWRVLSVMRSTMWCCKAYAIQRMKPGSYITKKAARKLDLYLTDEFMERIVKECLYL